MTDFLFEVALKSLPLAAFGLLAVRCMDRKSASAKFTLLSAIFATLLVLPIATAFSPKIAVAERPAQVAAVLSPQVVQTSVFSSKSTAVSPRFAEPGGRELPWSVPEMALGLWALGVLACWLSLLKDIVSVVRSLPKSGRRGGSIAWAGNDVFGPFVWGWFRPQIVLPSTLRHWDHGVRSALIAHELAHVQRGDWPLRIAFRLIRGLYWFNPLIWVLEKRAAMESEIACDDLVVSAGTDPASYAEGLLEVAKMQRLSTAPGAGSPRLKTRLVALFDKSRDRTQASRRIKAAALLAAVAGVAAVAPLSIGSEAPVETTRIPVVLREATQSSINQRPQSTSGFRGQLTAKPPAGVLTRTNNAGTVRPAVNGQNVITANRASGVNRVSRVGQGSGAAGFGSNSVNGQAPAAARGGAGTGSTAVNGQAPAASGQGGAGGFGSTSVNGQAPAVISQGGGGAGFGSTSVNGQAPAATSQGGGGAGFGSTGVSGAPGAARGGAGSNRVSATSAGGQQGGGFGGTVTRVGQAGGGFGGNVIRAGQGADNVVSGGGGHINQLTSRPEAGEGMVSAMTKTDEPLGTKILDLGDGVFFVTHVTDLGKFTAQGRNIELYKNGVVVLRKPLSTNQKPVREVAGYVTSAMSGRGSLAYVRPDSP